MAYTASFSLDLGATGLTLKAALTAAGAIHSTFKDVTTTFYADAAGGYEFLTAAIPDGYRGRIIFYTGTIGASTDFAGVTVKSSASINPQEIENTDSKTSGVLTEVQKVPRTGATHTYTNTGNSETATVAIT